MPPRAFLPALLLCVSFVSSCALGDESELDLEPLRSGDSCTATCSEYWSSQYPNGTYLWITSDCGDPERYEFSCWTGSNAGCDSSSDRGKTKYGACR